jgi:hypothetical protein
LERRGGQGPDVGSQGLDPTANLTLTLSGSFKPAFHSWATENLMRLIGVSMQLSQSCDCLRVVSLIAFLAFDGVLLEQRNKLLAHFE